MPSITPDQHALNIARVVQREVAPNIVILFGSRATGQHREDSDVDLLVVSLDGPQKGGSAGRAASAYMNENPPFLEVNIVNMTLAEFQRNRRGQTAPGRASRPLRSSHWHGKNGLRRRVRR